MERNKGKLSFKSYLLLKKSKTHNSELTRLVINPEGSVNYRTYHIVRIHSNHDSVGQHIPGRKFAKKAKLTQHTNYHNANIIKNIKSFTFLLLFYSPELQIATAAEHFPAIHVLTFPAITTDVNEIPENPRPSQGAASSITRGVGIILELNTWEY